MNNMVYCLYISNDLMGVWKEHPSSPISEGKSHQRNAGAIMNVDGMLIRPAQENRKHYAQNTHLFKITEFSIGFGKVIFQRVNKRGEKISLRLFPLGGYCAFEGEEDNSEENQALIEYEESFIQKVWNRILKIFKIGESK